jgi:hypothetical protein
METVNRRDERVDGRSDVEQFLVKNRLRFWILRAFAG